MTTPALQLDRINKNFAALSVARDIDLSLAPGARHALIGPNGAGKTTLVNLITGVLQPSSGQIFLAGKNITYLSQAKRSSLGLARTFQVNQLFRGLNVLDNVSLAIAERLGAGRSLLRPLGWRSDVADEAMAVLESLSLEAVALQSVQQLPYGQQRLVELAIALAQKPSVLLLDEPAAGVPPTESRIILDVIAALDEQLAIMIIEHDMDVVFRFAEHISVLVGGALLAQGRAADIAEDERVRAAYLGTTVGQRESAF